MTNILCSICNEIILNPNNLGVSEGTVRLWLKKLVKEKFCLLQK